MLTLSIQDLSMMKNEFYEIYTQIFENSLTLLKRTMFLKLRAINHVNKSVKKTSALSNMVDISVPFFGAKSKFEQPKIDILNHVKT